MPSPWGPRTRELAGGNVARCRGSHTGAAHRRRLASCPVFQFLVRLTSPQQRAAPTPEPRALLALVQRQLALPTGLQSGPLGALGQWAALVPEGQRAFPLVHVAREGHVAVLFFGRLDDFCATPAEQVLRAYSTGGAAAVSRLGGVFCAVVTDEARAESVIVTDVVGQRAPRFVESDGELFVASHQLALHAVGREALELDRESALSLLACDWSLGGRSLYRGIGSLRSGTFLRWKGGAATACDLPLLGVESRLEPGDTRGISECMESVIETLRASLRHVLASEGPVPRPLSLTAGLDSRTVLALSLSVSRDKQAVLAVTRGGRRSQDVVWARRVAQLAGVAHRIEPEPSVEPDYFLTNARLMALATDGTGNAKRACSQPESLSSRVPLGGEGGETLRGYYYDVWSRHSGRRRGLQGRASPSELAAVIIRKMRSRLRPVMGSAQLEPPVQRLEEAFGHFARFSGCISDQLDLYYILERYRHWAAQRWRQTWRDAWCAFSPAAISAAFRLPAPVGTTGIAETIIQRYLPPAVYWLPVNGYRMLPLHGQGALSRLAQASLKRVYAGWRRLEPLPSEAPDDQRGALFAGPLYETIHDLLGSASSSATALLGPSGLRRLLDEHRTSHRHTEALGFLVTMDLYVRQVRELRHPTARAD